MIELKDVSFNYGKKLAVKNLNLKIEKGEFISIIGHNGSGKSTLGRLLNALLIPSEGDVFVDEMNTKDFNNVLEIRKRVGEVFQNPDNQAVATIVEEDIAFGPENLRLPSEEIKRRVDAALKAVGMEEYRKHAPHLLSGGQKQRIAIAGILAMEPDYIVLDESTAMLDPQGRKDVLEIAHRLNEEGKTIILITHNMEETIKSDRIIVMNDGEKIMEGPPREIFQREEDLFQAGLVLPVIVGLSHALKRAGVSLTGDVLTAEELVKAI